jgi:hypothetical protein
LRAQVGGEHHGLGTEEARVHGLELGGDARREGHALDHVAPPGAISMSSSPAPPVSSRRNTARSVMNSVSWARSRAYGPL